MHCSNYARRVRWNGTKAVLLFTFVSFHSGTHICEQQKEHWPEVSTDVEMRWSEEKIRELSIYLNEDPPATPYTCSSNQHQDTRSISAEIVTNMAAGDVSTARIAAATMHQEAVTSSTAACIHQHTYQEETNERTSGMSYNYDERRRWLVFSRKYVCTRYVVQVSKHFIVPILLVPRICNCCKSSPSSTPLRKVWLREHTGRGSGHYNNTERENPLHTASQFLELVLMFLRKLKHL